ncbi:hypothetical protein MKX54_01240 [Alkalihalobacillus sp. FSL R5-0424]
MSNVNTITFKYKITSPSHALSNKHRSDATAILGVEADFSIWCKGDRFVRIEGLTIIEFYKSVVEWLKVAHKDHPQAFHYFSVDHDESEGPILSVVPVRGKVSMHSIWSDQEQPLVLEQNEVMNAFILLEQDLKKEIEQYFSIDLKAFIKHVPYRTPT